MVGTYLDHAATTPMHPVVIQEMVHIMEDVYGNPSSIHQFGRQAHEKLESARQIIADSLKVKPHEIIFNSGGTEGDNTAIYETAMLRQSLGKHIITTAVEHPAVLNTMKYMETIGFEVTYLPVNKNGQIAVADFKEALRGDTILVSIMYINNETGNIFPIEEIGALLKEHNAYFHTDAVQAYGVMEIDPCELGIDLLSVSAHKFNGPKGIGFLYKSDAIKLPPLIRGGEQEEKRRAGTENLAAIVGMGKAAELLTSEEKKHREEQYREFELQVLNALDEAEITYQINGDPEHKTPHILNISVEDACSDILLMKMDMLGYAISTGSACTAGAVDPSHVLEAMYGKNHSSIQESFRVSFGLNNTKEEVARFTETLIQVIKG